MALARHEAATLLVSFAAEAHRRGWVPATSGNFSAVLQRSPLRLAITPSGADKGRLAPEQILEIDETGRPVAGDGRPSAETPLHLAVVRACGAGAVAHTHSTWATLLSGAAGPEGLLVEGYEMLKALSGVDTHGHRERIPVMENTQDWGTGAGEVEDLLRRRPEVHAFLIRRHGLYTWGRDVGEAWRHLEALEYLLEVEGLKDRPPQGVKT